MKAIIYARNSNEAVKDGIIERCKKFCLKEGLEIKNVYFDIGIHRSSAKNKWKGFLELLKEVQEGDCIVCERILDLPSFFLDTNLSVPIRFPGDLNLIKQFRAIKNEELTNYEFVKEMMVFYNMMYNNKKNKYTTIK